MEKIWQEEMQYKSVDRERSRVNILARKTLLRADLSSSDLIFVKMKLVGEGGLHASLV